MTNNTNKPSLSDRLNKELDISNTSRELIEEQRQEALQSMSNDDFDKARESLRRLIDMGFDSLEDISILSKDSEHPKIYEVMSKMMDSIRQSSTELMEASKKKQEFDKANKNSPNEGDQSPTNNFAFIGTTDEIIDKIMNSNNSKSNSNKDAVDAEFTTDKDK